MSVHLVARQTYQPGWRTAAADDEDCQALKNVCARGRAETP
jgi:hypothetical protein